MNKAATAYFQTQLSTTTQGDLLLMLYDGALKFLRQAKVKIDEKDYAAKGILISKAMDVIAELDSSLNVEKGGDLADNLHKLYFYCSTRLLNANLKMDVNYIDEVIKILTGLRDAFDKVNAEYGGAPVQTTTQDMRARAAAPRPAAAPAPPRPQQAAPLAQGLPTPPRPPQAQAPRPPQSQPPRPPAAPAAPPKAPAMPTPPPRPATVHPLGQAQGRRLMGANAYKNVAENHSSD